MRSEARMRSIRPSVRFVLRPIPRAPGRMGGGSSATLAEYASQRKGRALSAIAELLGCRGAPVRAGDHGHGESGAGRQSVLCREVLWAEADQVSARGLCDEGTG